MEKSRAGCWRNAWKNFRTTRRLCTRKQGVREGHPVFARSCPGASMRAVTVSILPVVIIGQWLAAARAVAGAPSIENVAPGVGQRGTEFQLRLVGAGLAEAADLLFYSPGVVCAGLQAVSDNEVTVTVRAAADCPLGSYPFRLR